MRKRIVNHNPDSDGRVNHIFGIFEMAGSIGSSLINKKAQDETNEMNHDQWLEEMAYKRERDSIEDSRYEDEISYQRALQERLFEREDTQLERQAQQLSNLGINPLSQNLNGLPSASLTPQGSNSHATGETPSYRAQAFTGFNLGIAPSMEFLNAIDNIQTNGVQRDLLRSQENFQRLQNMAYANSHGITLDSSGNPISINPDVSEQELRQADLDYKKEHGRNEKASANRNERVDSMQALTGATDRTASNLQPAYDVTWQAHQVATNIKAAYNNHVDNLDPSDDSDKSTLSTRLNQVKNMAFGFAASRFVKAQKFLKKLTEKNDAIIYGSVPDRSGRMR